MNTSNLLIDFVTKLQLKYPRVIFRFEYDSEEELYRIWHTYTEVYTDQNFCDYMGQMISEIFVPAGFFDYYIELNTQFVQAMNTKLTWQITNLESINLEQIPRENLEVILTNVLVRNYLESSSKQGDWEHQDNNSQKDETKIEKLHLAA